MLAKAIGSANQKEEIVRLVIVMSSWLIHLVLAVKMLIGPQKKGKAAVRVNTLVAWPIAANGERISFLHGRFAQHTHKSKCSQSSGRLDLPP